ncbi:hypothetical protein SAMN05421736_10992 [Evansella caseinilytica]|uniref:Uncharacterized protein n=1 Tax=Evansella caseinilytica TaxID=1503961 RepID=A0A1H3RWB1_9BACI|nr:hypothetical protein [Evansella caseinilytica]SDZ29917.1 hypothetical protein SAMN05421736_10992 [Evansella caseinilytica]
MEGTNVKKPFYKRWWFIAIIVILLIGAIANAGNDEEAADDDADSNDLEEVTDNDELADDPVEEEPEELNDEDEAAEEPEEPVQDSISFGTGMFLVNDEIEPGLYRNDGGMFYWERLSGFGGTLDEIIANGNPSGIAYVEILESDEAFSSSGSGEWILIDDDYEFELLTAFGDGQYLVGKDIAPGKYRNDDATTGYWARLSSFKGDLDSIIANDIVDGSVVVEISDSDFGFETSGSGTWTKMD